MRLIDADRLLEERRMKKYYHLPNGDTAIPIIDIEHAPTVELDKRWIPVSERLPKYEMDVLLQFTSNMCVGYFHPSESWIIWSGGDWCTGVLEGDEEPIAWMPLPEPWKEGNNEVE